MQAYAIGRSQRFFELKPTEAVSLANLSEFFFQVLDSGNMASVAYDLIALESSFNKFSGNQAVLRERGRV